MTSYMLVHRTHFQGEIPWEWENDRPVVYPTEGGAKAAKREIRETREEVGMEPVEISVVPVVVHKDVYHFREDSQSLLNLQKTR